MHQNRLTQPRELFAGRERRPGLPDHHVAADRDHQEQRKREIQQIGCGKNAKCILRPLWASDHILL